MTWGEQITAALKKTNWKNPHPLLNKHNPRWQENRQELYDMLFPVNRGLAQDIWWWTDGIYISTKYLRILMMPAEELPTLLSDPDPVVQVIISWRFKHERVRPLREKENIPDGQR